MSTPKTSGRYGAGAAGWTGATGQKPTMFGKKHYEKVALVLHGTKPTYDFDDAEIMAKMAQWERTCLAFLNHFKTDNPRFDGDRFLSACKGT